MNQYPDVNETKINLLDKYISKDEEEKSKHSDSDCIISENDNSGWHEQTLQNILELLEENEPDELLNSIFSESTNSCNIMAVNFQFRHNCKRFIRSFKCI